MQLGEFALDLDAGTLTHATRGLVAVRPQAWCLLAVLARHCDQVVTKEQLLVAVWPGLVVSDGSIAQAVSDLRAVLDDKDRALIRTVARRGYLLVATPTVVASMGVEPASTTPVPIRLPAQGNRLFGREAESRQLLQTVAEHRLVSLLGAGGVGKTVLALAAAHAWTGTEGAAAVWVDLAPVADATLLPATLARAFDLPASPGDNALRGLLAVLEQRAGLLVLDNAEHLIEAVADVVAALLDRAPGLHLLITSQAPLQLRSERRFQLDALPLPPAGASLEQARLSASVAYFEDRGAALDRRFTLDEDNVASVVRICRRLGGLPLAIRLAAGRLHLLGLSALELHLQDRFEWPASLERDAPERQHTLRAALEWSYGLLTATQQVCFRRTGVFAGSFAADLAQQVVASPLGVGHGDARVGSVLNDLVERSLVDIVDGDPPRFLLLETQRAWALHELERLGEVEAVQRLHALTYAQALEDTAATYWETPDAHWLPRWSRELDNLRVALAWSLAHEPLTAVRLVAAAEPLFRMLGLAHEARRVGCSLDAHAAVHTMDGVDDELATRFHLAMASLEINSAVRRHAHAASAEVHARRWGDARGLYLALAQQLTSYMLESDAARPALAEMEALESPHWPPRLRCRGWLAKKTVELVDGCWSRALQAAETGFELAVQADAALLRGALGNAQLVALLSGGRIDEALARSTSLRSHVLPGPADTAIVFHGTCAQLRLLKGELPAARRLLGEMFELCRAVDWCRFEPFSNVYFMLALAEHRDESAARLLGYAESATRRAWGLPRFADTRDAARTELSRRLDAARLEALCIEGATLCPNAVCTLALGNE